MNIITSNRMPVRYGPHDDRAYDRAMTWDRVGHSVGVGDGVAYGVGHESALG